MSERCYRFYVEAADTKCKGQAMRKHFAIVKAPAVFPALLDRVEITMPGRSNHQGEVRGHCTVDGEDLFDVLLADEKHTIVQNLPADRIVCIVRRKEAA
jgi:hypothetical protein